MQAWQELTGTFGRSFSEPDRSQTCLVSQLFGSQPLLLIEDSTRRHRASPSSGHDDPVQFLLNNRGRLTCELR